MSDTVKLRYAAMSNVKFRGEFDTGIDREEWDEMTDTEQNDAIIEALFELVDIGPVNE